MEGKGFFLFIGNGGGVEITFDGVSKGVLGKEGKVLRVTLPEGAKLPEPKVIAEPEVQETEKPEAAEFNESAPQEPSKGHGDELF